MAATLDSIAKQITDLSAAVTKLQTTVAGLATKQDWVNASAVVATLQKMIFDLGKNITPKIDATASHQAEQSAILKVSLDKIGATLKRVQ